MRQENFPDIFGECCIYASKDASKANFEGPGGLFGGIAYVQIRGAPYGNMFPTPP